MGKLRRVMADVRLRRAFTSWTLPMLLAAAILFGIHANVQADPAPTTSELQQYLTSNRLNVYVSTGNNYPQIYYEFEDRQIMLTSANHPHLHPVVSGQYIAWQGVIGGTGQIFLYDVLTDSLTQLSFTDSNEGAYIYRDTVVWQGWDGEHWQIYYYNGLETQQITNNADSSSVHAITDGRQIVYAEQLGVDDWKAQSYDIASGELTTIRQGDTVSTAYPQFNQDGSIRTAFVQN